MLASARILTATIAGKGFEIDEGNSRLAAPAVALTAIGVAAPAVSQPGSTNSDSESFLSTIHLYAVKMGDWAKGDRGEVSGSRVEHRFAVVMCADVGGYSRLMGMDEEGTLARLNAVRRNLFDPRVAEHGGRIVRAMGDGFLVEFHSVVDAVRCAVKVQNEMPEHTAEMPEERRIQFRMAIAMGDVVTDGDLIYGQAVDVGSRMESLAEPGGINVSRAVRDQVRDRLPIAFQDLGEHQVKNVARPVRAFRIVMDTPRPATAAPNRAAGPPEKPSVAVVPFQN